MCITLFSSIIFTTYHFCLKSDNKGYKTYTVVLLMPTVDLLQVSKGMTKKLILKGPDAKDCFKQVMLWLMEVSMVESRKPLDCFIRVFLSVQGISF